MNGSKFISISVALITTTLNHAHGGVRENIKKFVAGAHRFVYPERAARNDLAAALRYGGNREPWLIRLGRADDMAMFTYIPPQASLQMAPRALHLDAKQVRSLFVRRNRYRNQVIERRFSFFISKDLPDLRVNDLFPIELMRTLRGPFYSHIPRFRARRISARREVDLGVSWLKGMINPYESAVDFSNPRHVLASRTALHFEREFLGTHKGYIIKIAGLGRRYQIESWHSFLILAADQRNLFAREYKDFPGLIKRVNTAFEPILNPYGVELQ